MLPQGVNYTARLNSSISNYLRVTIERVVQKQHVNTSYAMHDEC